MWQVQGDKLVKLSEKTPYFFRAITLHGSTKKLCAQAVGRESDFSEMFTKLPEPETRSNS
jgi:hypothetical protein